MEPLDGNAIAGALYASFGAEMTTVTGRCTSCGATSVVAELRVYAQAPGMVVRCPGCGSVLMVLVDVRGTPQTHLPGIELAPPAGG